MTEERKQQLLHRGSLFTLYAFSFFFKKKSPWYHNMEHIQYAIFHLCLGTHISSLEKCLKEQEVVGWICRIRCTVFMCSGYWAVRNPSISPSWPNLICITAHTYYVHRWVFLSSASDGRGIYHWMSQSISATATLICWTVYPDIGYKPAGYL